jgi:hypothetical protein
LRPLRLGVVLVDRGVEVDLAGLVKFVLDRLLRRSLPSSCITTVQV